MPFSNSAQVGHLSFLRISRNIFSAYPDYNPTRYLAFTCIDFQNGYMPIKDQAEIMQVAKTCLKNIRATAPAAEYNKMIKLSIKEWKNKSVKELLKCLPKGETV